MPTTATTTAPTTEPLLRAPPSDQLTFRRATVGEKLITWTRNFTSWAGPLSRIEDYLVRETINGTQDVTKDGRITYWVLTSRAIPPGHEDDDGEEVDPDEIFAAVETLERPALVKTKDGHVREDKAFGIASVFTHPRCRKQGIATILLKHLASWLDNQTDVPFTALYSDVGKEFYATRGGWNPYPSRQAVLKVLEPSESKSRPKVQWLEKLDLERLCALDVRGIKEMYEELARQGDQSVRVAFQPTFAQACWHFGTESHVGKIVTGKDPVVKGAAVDDDAFLYWTHDFRDNHLVVLRVRAPGSTDDESIQRLAALIAAAHEEAKKWNFNAIVVWNPTEAFVKAAKLVAGDVEGAVDVNDRENDSVPCLRWRGNQGEPNIQWDANEKFAWC
ncbi:MAG: hypothetical protein M1823_000280 [Watsoniomyces obsoletus]|nr:MAG: hypothetical protein M1823_000280 [Watsoniomyces obsoletus]